MTSMDASPPPNKLPENLNGLHEHEERLRHVAVSLVDDDDRLLLHFRVAEAAMDLMDVFRQVQTDDEDLKVVQMLGLRMFNALASSIKLMLSGYTQTSAMILRDILETVFLVDLFRTDRTAITRWRLADRKQRLEEFQPFRVRAALDHRDGVTSKKRDAAYRMFSELAGHPTMLSAAMLRPPGMDARNGPFVDQATLEAAATEMGQLAVQVGELVDPFFPKDSAAAMPSRLAFARAKAAWIAEFIRPADDRQGDGASNNGGSGI